MGTLTDVIAQAGKPDDREQAIIDRHKNGARKGSLFQDVAEGMAEIEIDTRRQQRAYAEKPTSEIGQIMAAPTKEMISSLGDRSKVLNTIRSLTPEQRQEALRLAPGIAQQLGDDRGGMVGRTLGAVSRGVSHGVSQPIMELAGQVTGNDFGGTAEEIAYIRELDKAASQEFSPARPGDPWYQSGPLQAAEMLPWMATVVGGGGAGRQAATEIAKRVTAKAAAGSRVAGAVQAVGQAVGKFPQTVGAKVGLNSVPAIAAGKVGELAGITAAAFPGQYAQEVDSLKALGMVDDTKLRLLAGGTAAITGLVEGIVPNPFKAGDVSLTQGATKAARQYLWNAVKNAPGELTEEYLQGVTSGLGEHIAQYVGSEVKGVNPAKKKTLEDAFKKGWEQSKEAALPMAFLLGVPAVGGAGLAAARARQGTSVDGMPVEGTMPPSATQQPLPTEQQSRDTVSQTTPPALPPSKPPISDTVSQNVTQPPALPAEQQDTAGRAAKLGEIISKGFVSKEDADSFGIPGETRKERLANAKAELEHLDERYVQPKPVADQSEADAIAKAAADRKAAKSGVKPPALPEQQPPKLPIPENRDTVSQNPPLPEPAKKAPPVEAPVVGSPDTHWDQMKQEGRPGKEAMRQTVLSDAEAKAAANKDFSMFADETSADKVEAYRSMMQESGFEVGPASYDKKEGTVSWSVKQAKTEPVQDMVSQTEQPKNKGKKTVEPATPEATVTTLEPQRTWKRDDRVFVAGHTTDKGEKVPNSVGNVVKEYTDGVVVQLDGESGNKYRFVSKDKLQQPDAKFEVGEKVGVPWSAEKTGTIEGVLPDGNYQVTVAGRGMSQTADQMVKLDTPKAEVLPIGDSAPQTETPTAPQMSDDEFRQKTKKLWDENFEKWAEASDKKFGRTTKEQKQKARENASYNASRATPDSLLDAIEETLGVKAIPDDLQQRRTVKNSDVPIVPTAKKNGKKEQPVLLNPPRSMEPTEEGRPSDGKPIMPGDRFLTNTKRETTPYPKYDGSTNRKAIAGEKKSQEWLIENAIAEAESRGDEFNARTFRKELEEAKKGKLPQASKDSATLYVFGDYIPKIPKSSLKDVPKQPEAKKRDTVSQNPKPETENKDAPQPKKGGDPNEVQAKDGQQKQTNAEAETNAKAEAKGQVGSKGDQAAVEAPSPDSSYEWKKGSNGLEAKGLDGYIRLLPAKDQLSMDGPAQDAYWISAPSAKNADPSPQTETHYSSLGEAKKALVEANNKYGKSRGLANPTVKDILSEEKPLSEWEQGVADLLATVPAFKGASFAMSKDKNTVKVTRPDGRTTTINFNADEQLDKLAKKNGMAFVYGAYNYREGSKSDGHIFLRSNGDSETLNHEVVHWLEDEGIITAKEVEKYGGREGLAEAYGVWAANKSRPANTLFEKIYEFLDSIFNVNTKFFKELTERVDATKPTIGKQIKDIRIELKPKIDEFFDLADNFDNLDVDRIDQVQGEIEVLDEKLLRLSNGRFNAQSSELDSMSPEQIEAEVAKALDKKQKSKKEYEDAKVADAARDAEREAKRKEMEASERAEREKEAKETQDRIDSLSKFSNREKSNIDWDRVEQIRAMDKISRSKLVTNASQERYLNENYDFPEEGKGSQRIVGVRPKNEDVPDVFVTGSSKAEVKNRLLMAADEAVVASYSKKDIGSKKDQAPYEPTTDSLTSKIQELDDQIGDAMAEGKGISDLPTQLEEARSKLLEDRVASGEKYTITIVGCCDKKAKTKRRARDLYQSDLFKKSSDYAKQNSDEWMIASAKYGLVTPGEHIEPYDQRMGQSADAIRQAGSIMAIVQKLPKSAFQKQPNGRVGVRPGVVKIVVLAGKDYVDAIKTKLPESVELVEPLQGMAIGQRLQWLKNQVAGEKPEPAIDQDELDGLMLDQLDKIIEAEKKTPTKPSPSKGKKVSSSNAPDKTKQGQYVLSIFPDMAEEIDRQDFVRKYRERVFKKILDWPDNPRDTEEAQDAVETMAKPLSVLINELYAGKNKDIDEVWDSKAYVDVSDTSSKFSFDGAILEDLDDVIRDILAARPKKGIKKPRKSEQTLKEAKSDMQLAHEAAAKAMALIRSKLMMQIDPEISAQVIQVAYLYAKAGVKTFKGYVEAIVENFGEAFAKEFAPYMKSGWKALNVRGYVNDPAGNVDDYLTKENEDGQQLYTEGDGTDQEGVPGGVGNERESRGPATDGSLEEVQSGDGQATGTAADNGGLRGSDSGSIQQGSGSTDVNVQDVDVGSTTGESGDSATGSGEDGFSVPGDGSGINLAPKSSRPNFHLTNPDVIVGRGLKDKFARNVRALELSQELDESGRSPTQEDLEILASYIGWGAFGQELFQGNWNNTKVKKDWESENEWLREHLGEEEWRSAQESIPNAHYTDPEVVSGIWSMIKKMGFKGGRFLEPSFGVGNFAALMPRDMMSQTNFTAIELDKATARIAKILYPQINVQQKGYQDSRTPNDFYDVTATNVPFGDYKIVDRMYRMPYSIHNYFFRKAIDQTKPGGLMVFVTSNMTMDGKEEAKLLRKQLSDRGDLVAAFRFPTGAFERYAKTKVVADLIIIRKRNLGEEPSPLNKEWIDIVEVDTPSGEKIDVNEYWTKHPENILGTLNHGHGTTSGRPGMIVDKPADLEERWSKAIESVPSDILNTDRKASEGKERANERKLRQNTVVHQNDELYIAKGEQLIPLKEYVKGWYRSNSKPATIKKARDEIVALLKVRDSLESVLEIQGRGEDAAKQRKELNYAYDTFVAKYGPITTSSAIGHLKAAGDAIANAVASLESRNANGEYEKRPVFTRTTVRQAPRVGEKLNPIDAFALARNNSINIDWDDVAKMSRMPKRDVLSQLQREGLIYKTGDETYEAADVFLSGNMAQKIRQLEAAKNEGAVGLDRSIDAAKKAMPEPLVYNQIQVSMGAPWITAEDYSQFFAELLSEDVANTKVLKAIKGWKVEFTTSANRSPAVVTHGHADVAFSKMVAAAMNNGRVTIFYKDAEGNSHKDETATLEANAKIDELKDKFKDWIWQSPDRIARLSQAYNEDHRAVAIPDWKKVKVPLLFEGLALQRGDDPFSLRKHQETAVWRAIVAGKGLFAHEVGTGKTLTMASVAIESRRLRLANKPVLFAHNANSQAVYREAQEAYPGAKILYVDNLDAKNKGQAMASIATEDWDLIVIPHSLVENLKMRPETLEKLLQEQMDQLEAAALEAFNEDDSPFKGRMPTNLDNVDEEDMKKLKQRTAKELVKERLRLRERIRAAQSDAANESTIFIEDMGIDMLLVDEAHIFKKIPLATRQQVKGLNKKASDIGNSLMLLSDYIRGTQNGRGIYLFTGTPITNTLNEIYNMQRFIMPDEMQAVGVKDWDGWFNTFATAETSDELSAGGTYEEFERLTSFVNLPELRASIGQYMDTVFASEMPEFIPRKSKEGRVEEGDPIIGRPYKEVHNDTLQMMPIQKRLSEDLKRRYRALRDAKGKAKFEMMRMREYMPLVINGEGVKLALDPRLMDGVNVSQIDPRDSRLKVNKMLLNAMDYYHSHPKATQMIFMEMGHEDTASRTVGRDNDGKPIKERVKVFNLAKEIKRRLMEEGVPESEIAIFSAMTKEKRAEAARAMNRGEIRFAIGGTETLGTGINAQENLIAMHHMDAPWMPGALEQRNGRGHRQGNRWNTVHEHRYLTEGPQDGRRWQVLLTKDRFIYRFMHHKGDERIIDMSDVDMDEEGQGDFESTFSAAVGDPRIQQRFKLEREIVKLTEAKDRHHRTIQDSLWEAHKQETQDIPRLSSKMESYQSIQKKYQESRPEKTDSGQSVEPVLVLSDIVKVPNKTVMGSEAISNALEHVSNTLSLGEGTKRKIGEYRGVSVFLANGALGTGVMYAGDMSLEIKPSFASLDGILRNLEKRIDTVKSDLSKKESFVKSANESSKLPFVRQPQLDAKQKKLKSLIEEIEANPDGSPYWFRNMAPIGTSIYTRQRKRAGGMQSFYDMQSEMDRERFGGGDAPQNVTIEFEEHAVSGYRSDTHILYEDGDGSVAVPVSKVFNENGEQTFADIEDLRQLNDTSADLTQAINNIPNPPSGPTVLYQTDDVDPSFRTQALDIAFAADDAGIKSYDKLVAYSVKTVGERRTREIGEYLRLAANAVGFENVRAVGDVLGSPNVTKEQAAAFAKAAFPMLSDEQIEAGVAIVDRLGLLDKIGFAPFGTSTPEQDQNQKRGGNVKGWTSFISATRALIGATNKADISTFIHEFAHPMRRFLLNREIPQSQRADITDAELNKLEKAVGVENGEWKVENEEKFAKMWEQYWFDGKAPRNSGLEGFFEKIARWMQTVYKNIQQITSRQLPQEVRDLFDKLVRNGDEEIRDTVSQNENRDTVSQNGDRDVTSIKNALMNEKRFLRGVRALDDVSKQTQDEWLDAAEALLQDDPMLGDQLVKEINTKARNLSNVEVAVMQIHYRGMNNRLEKVSDRLFKAKDSKDAAESAKALIDVDMVMNALVEIEEAAKAAGREWGRAGVARQIELEKDFSRVAVLRKARIANGGNALNEQQLADMDALAKRVAELEGDLAKAIQDKLDIERKKNVESQIEDSKTKARSVPESIGKKAVERFNAFKSKFASAFASSGKTDSLFATEDEQMVDEAKSVIQVYSDMGIFSLGEFLANIRKELGTDLPVSVQAAFTTAWNEMKSNGDIVTPMVDKNDVRGLSRLAKQIERSLVEAGVTKLEDVVRGVRESLQEIIPDITERETMDAISGYGQYSAPSEDPNDKIIADINGRLLELAKLNDMENKIAPARTGVGRQEKSPEHRELIRKVNLAKREGKYRVTDPDTQLKSAVGSALTALTNRIYDLNKAINVTKQPIVSATKEDLAAQDARVVKLRKERDELTAIYKTMFPKPGATMEQRIAATDRALDRVIADLEKQLETENFTTGKKSEPISTKELDAKRARIDALRAQREAIVGVKKKTDEQLAKAYKANLLKQIADYKDKSLHSYFAPKPKKETRTLSSEELRLMKELQDVKDDFFKRAGLYRLENMSPRERAWDYVKETAHLSRALMTSLDFSAVFRQGGAVAFAHPMMAASTSMDMYKAMWSDAAAFDMAAKIRIDDMYQFAMTAGLSITEEEGKITKQEEAYMGRWARLGLGAPGSALNTISKGVLTPVSSSARGYMTFLNGIRFNLFKNMVANLGKGGQVTADEAKVIAMYINAATGRSELGPMMKWAEQANMLFFAPRFVASRFQYLGMPLWLLGSKKVSGRVKKAIAMEYIRHSASVGTFLALTVALGSLLGDDDDEKPTVSLDLRSSDFLKIKLGETRIDPMSGLSQVITLLGRVASGQRVGADGKVIDLRGEDAPYGGLGVAGTVGNFVRTKFAPIPGAAFDVATGENVVGQPVTPFSSIVNLFYPLSLREIQDTAQSRGIPQGALIALVSLHGMGASTYGPESNYRKGTDEQKKKQFDKGIKKMTFDSPDPAYKEMLSKDQLSEVSERREERKQDLVYAASANPIRKEYKSDDAYNQAVKERDTALENLKKSGMSMEEARAMLIKHWETSYGSAKEVRKGVRVYKEALSDRLRKLRRVFSE